MDLGICEPSAVNLPVLNTKSLEELRGIPTVMLASGGDIEVAVKHFKKRYRQMPACVYVIGTVCVFPLPEQVTPSSGDADFVRKKGRRSYR